MFAKKTPQPRPMTSVTVNPDWEQPEKVQERPVEEIEDEPEEETPEPAYAKPISKQEVKPVITQKPKEEEQKQYSFIVGYELIDSNTIQYIVRSNIAMRPGFVDIKEID
jgi:hypothetical protein